MGRSFFIHIHTVGWYEKERMENKMKEKNFLLVVIGQIISLFGNAMLRFALPQHLLTVTASSALYGLVSALAFLPMLVMSPLGGALADRVNKRNIMVGLDFFTAALILGFLAVSSRVNLTVSIGLVLFVLYGISGAYQPAVQASIPYLVSEEHLVSANAVINMISSLSSLLGPVLGGILYSSLGLQAVLGFSGVCFMGSAFMELFIKIPSVRQEKRESLLRTLGSDLRASLHFIVRERPVVGKVTICIAAFNLFLSSLLLVGIPVAITQVIPFQREDPSRLVGYIEGAFAVGSLTGGVLSGILGERQKEQESWRLLFLAGIFLLPMAWALGTKLPPAAVYGIFCVGGFLIMICATMFTVRMMAFVQRETPGELMGKVIAWVIAIATCAQPLGQALYGFLFEAGQGKEGIIFAAGAGCSIGIAFLYKKIFVSLC